MLHNPTESKKRKGFRFGGRFWMHVLVLGALLQAGCGGGNQAYPRPLKVVETVVVEVAGTPVIMRPPIETESPAAFEAPPPGDADLPYPAAGFGAFSADFQAGEQMVIKDAQLELLVENTDLAIERVTQMVNDRGGYILSSQVWNLEGSKRAELRLNVPSRAFEEALNYLRNLAEKVLSETAQGADISAEYTDLQARLQNLEATAARVRQFLDDARTVEDALRINTELSNLERQIEQIKGQMRYYEGRTAFSTIYVILTPDLPTPTPTATPGWSPGQTFQNASTAMRLFWQTVADVLIWAAILGWPFVVLIAIVWLLARRWRRRVKPLQNPPGQEGS